MKKFTRKVQKIIEKFCKNTEMISQKWEYLRMKKIAVNFFPLNVEAIFLKSWNNYSKIQNLLETQSVRNFMKITPKFSNTIWSFLTVPFTQFDIFKIVVNEKKETHLSLGLFQLSSCITTAKWFVPYPATEKNFLDNFKDLQKIFRGL